MTHITKGNNPYERPTNMHELSLSSSQTVSSGDVIKFDTLRSTSSGGVTNNSSTGEITLSSNYRYTLIASIDIERASTTDDVRVAFFDGATEITPANGGFDATWEYHASGSSTGQPNSTLQAWYTPDGAAASPVTLKVFDVSANSTINTSMTVLILEVEQ